MSYSSLPDQAAFYIREKTQNLSAKIAIVLGSGLGRFTESLEHPLAIPYEDIPGFTPCLVSGHQGQFWAGQSNKTPVYCLQGRNHWYEGHKEPFKIPIRTLKRLGVEVLVLTNAAASLRPEVTPGQLMLINDHINFQFNNPLVGVNDDEFGPRFFDMENAYDKELNILMKRKAEKIGLPLFEGVYMGVLGPNYETPAEIRAFRMLGADAVGMSTVSETILARHCGLRVVAISNITNMGVGMSNEILTHEAVLQVGSHSVGNLSRLITAFLEEFHD